MLLVQSQITPQSQTAKAAATTHGNILEVSKATYLRVGPSKNVSDITHGRFALLPPRPRVSVQPSLHSCSLGLGQGGEQHYVAIVQGVVPN